ncbi:hypothetical protein [Vulgatibacter sp.]|uniref:hypothetical protein n=1 Tax=Vulgatibacter sp. TaxID=1971226 RepID=UPI0035634151
MIPIRSSLVLLLLAAGCGVSEDDEGSLGPEPNGPPVCDLAATARTLVSEAAPCPPERCVIDSEAGTTTCQGLAVEQGGQACTSFVVAGDACGEVCAPPTCSLRADGLVACAPGCSADRTTCFAVAEGACPAPTLRRNSER